MGMLIWSSSTEMVVRWFCIERQGTNTSCNISDLLLSFDAENVANLTSGRCIHDIDGSSLGCKDQGTSNCKDYRIQNLSAMWTQPHGYSTQAVGMSFCCAAFSKAFCRTEAADPPRWPFSDRFF